jgi:hypothetical protein
VNLSSHRELLNNVQILILDSFHNIIAETHINPHQIINNNMSLSLNINLNGIENTPKIICVFINGKIVLEKHLPITP